MNKSYRVRVIEDNDALREAMLRVLEQAGFDTVGFSCAEDLDDTPNAHESDAYVIDLNLPGEDGLSLAIRLRGAQPNVVIVITTARTHLNDRIKGYESGANLYMPKPVDPGELVAAVRALIDQRNALQPDRTCLRLDSGKCILSGPAGEARLANAEVRLLMALAAAKNQTLERWQMNLHLNQDKGDISADNLQNRLSHLRKKLENCGVEGESIRAIRGVGYRLCVPITFN